MMKPSHEPFIQLNGSGYNIRVTTIIQIILIVFAIGVSYGAFLNVKEGMQELKEQVNELKAYGTNIQDSEKEIALLKREAESLYRLLSEIKEAIKNESIQGRRNELKSPWNKPEGQGYEP